MDVIVCHINADFDAAGALAGASLLFPGSVCVLPAGASAAVHRFLSMHSEVLPVRTVAEVDPAAITRVVVVDTCQRERLGSAGTWLDLPGVDVRLYDHHTEHRPDIPAPLDHWREMGSASALIANELALQNVDIPPAFATAMLLGIYEDTGCLTHSGTTPEDIEAAARLLRAGAELELVAAYAHRPLSADQTALLSELLESCDTLSVQGHLIALGTCRAEGYVDEASVLAERMLDVTGAQAAVVFAEMGGSLYVIGRSLTDSINIGSAVRALGGGGHPRAASANLRGAAAQGARERLLAALSGAVIAEPSAAQLMSHPVRTIGPGDPLSEAADRMTRYGHSGLAVIEDGSLVGVVTRRDVDKARHHRLEHAPVRAVMTRGPRTALPTAPLSELERVMVEEGIGRLLVVGDGQLLGVVTRTDVLRARYGERYLAGGPSHDPALVATAIRERLPARMQRLLARVGEVAAASGASAYAVGGFVRDLLLGVPNLDLDILVEPDGVALARSFARALGTESGDGAAGGPAEFIGPSEFGTAKVRLADGLVIDFATARTESYVQPGALPVVEPSSITDDLRRRDFTVNALAIDLHPERLGALRDPFGGKRDLDRRLLRVLHPLSFREDPTRIFRAVRLEVRFRMEMEPDTRAAALEAVAAGALAGISPERLRSEFRRTLAEPKGIGMLLHLERLGVLEWLAPGLVLDEPLLAAVPGALEWWERSGGRSADPFLTQLAAILTPLGELGAKVAENRLRLAPADVKRIAQAIVSVGSRESVLAGGGLPSETTAALRPLEPEAVALLRAAAGSAPDGKRQSELLDRYATRWRDTRLEISGDDLTAQGFRPGPKLGEALRRTLAAKLDGMLDGVANSGDRGRSAELEYARSVLS